METNSFSAWSGAQVPLKAIQGDPEADSASVVLLPQDGSAEIVHTANYESVDGEVVADLTFTTPIVFSETLYDYYVRENITGEDPLIYPSPDDCEGDDCSLPVLTVCPLGPETS